MANLFDPYGVNVTLENMYEKETRNGFALFNFRLTYTLPEDGKSISFWANDAVMPDSGIAHYYRKLSHIDHPVVKAILKQSTKNPQWVDVIKILYKLNDSHDGQNITQTKTVDSQKFQPQTVNIWK